MTISHPTCPLAKGSIRSIAALTSRLADLCHLEPDDLPAPIAVFVKTCIPVMSEWHPSAFDSKFDVGCISNGSGSLVKANLDFFRYPSQIIGFA